MEGARGWPFSPRACGDGVTAGGEDHMRVNDLAFAVVGVLRIAAVKGEEVSLQGEGPSKAGWAEKGTLK